MKTEIKIKFWCSNVKFLQTRQWYTPLYKVEEEHLIVESIQMPRDHHHKNYAPLIFSLKFKSEFSLQFCDEIKNVKIGLI